jgi:hypothetical protein
MPTRVTCPTCGYEAPLPDGLSSPAVKCPRCDELVRVPDWKRPAMPAPGSGPRQSVPPAANPPVAEPPLPITSGVGTGFRLGFGAALGVSFAALVLLALAVAGVYYAIHQHAVPAPEPLAKATEPAGPVVAVRPPPPAPSRVAAYPRAGRVLAKTEGDEVICPVNKEAVLFVRKATASTDRNDFVQLSQTLRAMEERVRRVQDGTRVTVLGEEVVRVEGKSTLWLRARISTGDYAGQEVLLGPELFRSSTTLP